LGGRPAAWCARRFMTKTLAASILPFGAPSSPRESMERPDSSSMRSISPSVRLLTLNMVWVPSQSDQLVLAEQLFQPGVERLEDVAAFTVERLDEELVGLYVTRRPAVVDNPRVRSPGTARADHGLGLAATRPDGAREATGEHRNLRRADHEVPDAVHQVLHVLGVGPGLRERADGPAEALHLQPDITLRDLEVAGRHDQLPEPSSRTGTPSISHTLSNV